MFIKKLFIFSMGALALNTASAESLSDVCEAEESFVELEWQVHQNHTFPVVECNKDSIVIDVDEWARFDCTLDDTNDDRDVWEISDAVMYHPEYDDHVYFDGHIMRSLDSNYNDATDECTVSPAFGDDYIKIHLNEKSLCHDPILNSIYDGELRSNKDQYDHDSRYFSEEVQVKYDGNEFVWEIDEYSEMISYRASLKCINNKPFIESQHIYYDDYGNNEVILSNSTSFIEDFQTDENGLIDIMVFSETKSLRTNITQAFDVGGDLYRYGDE